MFSGVVSAVFSGSYEHLTERTGLTLLELLDGSVLVKILVLVLQTNEADLSGFEIKILRKVKSLKH